MRIRSISKAEKRGKERENEWNKAKREDENKRQKKERAETADREVETYFCKLNAYVY